VIGHHPHVFQGIDASGGGLVAYSLGNFIFDSVSDRTDWSVILSITLSEGQTVDFQVIPVVRGDDFRPLVVDEAKAESLLREVARRNAMACSPVLETAAEEAAYQREVKSLDLQHRQQLWRYIGRHWFRYKPLFWPQILLRPIQRCLGLW